MEKSIEGDEYLDYLDETLEQRRNFRVVSLDHKSLAIRRVACFNGGIPVDRANSVCEATMSTEKSGFRKLTKNLISGKN